MISLYRMFTLAVLTRLVFSGIVIISILWPEWLDDSLVVHVYMCVYMCTMLVCVSVQGNDTCVSVCNNVQWDLDVGLL